MIHEHGKPKTAKIRTVKPVPMPTKIKAGGKKKKGMDY